MTDESMNFEKSCGAIVFTRRDGEIFYVVVEEQAGTHSFPKGHMEGDETEIETAKREIFEETGLRPRFVEGFRMSEEFFPAEKPGTRKQVVYFLAEFGDEPIIPRENDVRKVMLATYDETLRLIKFEGTRRILAGAHGFLTK